MKLFAIYIGGEHPQAHVEVHDVRFVVAPTIRDTYDRLRADWWGTPGTLHVDCWAEIDHADGYDVTLSAEPRRHERNSGSSTSVVTTAAISLSSTRDRRR